MFVKCLISESYILFVVSQLCDFLESPRKDTNFAG